VFQEGVCPALVEWFAWGLMARQALTEAGCPSISPVRSYPGGALSRYRCCMSPAAWASQKLIALEDCGQEEIRRFVDEGAAIWESAGGAWPRKTVWVFFLSRRKPTTEEFPA